MNHIFLRIKGILLQPKAEWLVIDQEHKPISEIISRFIIPLSLAAGLTKIISKSSESRMIMGIEVTPGILAGIAEGIIRLLVATISYVVVSYVVDYLAPYFKSEKNLSKSASLIAYGMTPGYISAILSTLPYFGIFSLFSLYSLYLWYLGAPILKKTPEDQRIPYLIVSVLATFLTLVLVNAILSMISDLLT